MIVFVHQPEYIPWLGFFDKLARCDTYVIYDDAQYQHGGFHNRNRIRTSTGWEWLTVPITHGHPQTIKEVKICGDEWKTKQLNSIKAQYRKTPYFQMYYPLLEEAILFNHELLIGLNLHLIKAVADAMGIKVNMMRSSEFPYGGTEKNEKLVSMCKFLGADTYLSGSGGQNYIKEELFRQAGVNIQWHSYEHPAYQQVWGGFEPNMSIVDLLFNEGPNAKEILQRGGRVAEKRIFQAQVAIQKEEAAPVLELHDLSVGNALDF
jgi:hypothetical protein